MFSKKQELDPYEKQKCEGCHYRGQPRPCPCWNPAENGLVLKNEKGEEKIMFGCFYQLMPRLMEQVVIAALRPVGMFEAVRDQVDAVGKMVKKTAEFTDAIVDEVQLRLGRD